MKNYLWVNDTASVNGLLLDGTKLLSEPCWLFISEVLWHSPENNFTLNGQATILYNEYDDYTFKIMAMSLRGEWVNSWILKDSQDECVSNLTR